MAKKRNFVVIQVKTRANSRSKLITNFANFVPCWQVRHKSVRNDVTIGRGSQLLLDDVRCLRHVGMEKNGKHARHVGRHCNYRASSLPGNNRLHYELVHNKFLFSPTTSSYKTGHNIACTKVGFNTGSYTKV